MLRLFRFIFFICLLMSANFARAEPNMGEIKQTISDSVITAKITAKFAKNRDLNLLKISVSTENGVVTLSGHVKDKEAFVNALRLAKNTKGVTAVEEDDLLIKQVNTSLTDAYITTKVEAAVLKSKVFDDESIPLVGINATTNDGVVTLSGKVKSNKSILAIVKRVSHIKGVKKLISQLEVSKDA